MPSVRFWGVSFGIHAHQQSVKSVSAALVAAYRVIREKPGVSGILPKDRGDIRQNVPSLLHGALIERPAGNDGRPTTIALRTRVQRRPRKTPVSALSRIVPKGSNATKVSNLLLFRPLLGPLPVDFSDSIRRYRARQHPAPEVSPPITVGWRRRDAFPRRNMAFRPPLGGRRRTAHKQDARPDGNERGHRRASRGGGSGSHSSLLNNEGGDFLAFQQAA